MDDLPIIATAAMFLFGLGTLTYFVVTDMLAAYRDSDAGCIEPAWPDEIDTDPLPTDNHQKD